jgi:hypothetical protein
MSFRLLSPVAFYQWNPNNIRGPAKLLRHRLDHGQNWKLTLDHRANCTALVEGFKNATPALHPR